MSKSAVEASEKQSPMERIAAFIVDKRKAFYLIYIGVAIFCAFSSGWVAGNDDLTSYLPDTTETRQGLTIMEEEFVTFIVWSNRKSIPFIHPHHPFFSASPVFLA